MFAALTSGIGTPGCDSLRMANAKPDRKLTACGMTVQQESLILDLAERSKSFHESYQIFVGTNLSAKQAAISAIAKF